MGCKEKRHESRWCPSRTNCNFMQSTKLSNWQVKLCLNTWQADTMQIMQWLGGWAHSKWALCTYCAVSKFQFCHLNPACHLKVWICLCLFWSDYQLWLCSAFSSFFLCAKCKDPSNSANDQSCNATAQDYAARQSFAFWIGFATLVSRTPSWLVGLGYCWRMPLCNKQIFPSISLSLNQSQ